MTCWPPAPVFCCLLLICLSIRHALTPPRPPPSHRPCRRRGASEAALSSGLQQNGHLFLNTDRGAETLPHPEPWPGGCRSIFTLARPGLVPGKRASGVGEVSCEPGEVRGTVRGRAERLCASLGSAGSGHDQGLGEEEMTDLITAHRPLWGQPCC